VTALPPLFGPKCSRVQLAVIPQVNDANFATVLERRLIIKRIEQMKTEPVIDAAPQIEVKSPRPRRSRRA
jgi:hypothetical protein